MTRVAGPRLNSRAELFRELRRKTVRALRMDKEAYVRGICAGIEHVVKEFSVVK